MSSMGQAALTVVGGVIGAFAGNPMLGAAIGSMVGGLLFPGRLPDQIGPRLQNQKVQSSAADSPIFRCEGQVRFAGNLIWSSGILETKHKKKYGGKGGPQGTVTTYSYRVHLAIALCEGPIVGITNIWADAILVYSKGALTDAVTLVARKQKVPSIKVYKGNDTQEPDPTIQSYEGVANTPAHRGLAYVVFDDFQLEKFGNRIPNFTFEVVTSGQESPRLTYTVDTPVWGSFDAAYAKSALYCGRNRFGAVTVVQFQWNSQYETSNIAVHTVYPNGKIVKGVELSTGLTVPPGGIQLAIGYSDTPAAVIWQQAGTNVHVYLFSGDGKQVKSGPYVLNMLAGQSNNFSNSGNVHIRDGYIWFHKFAGYGIGSLVNGFVYRVPYAGAGTALVYDPDANGLGSTLYTIFVGDNEIYGLLNTNVLKVWDLKFNLKKTIAFTPTVSLGYDHAGGRPSFLSSPRDGTVYIVGAALSGNHGHRIDVGTGVYTYIGELDTSIFGTSADYTGLHIDGDALTAFNPERNEVTFTDLGSIDAVPPTLASVITNSVVREGLTAGDVDVSTLTDAVEGYLIDRQQTSRDDLAPLLQAYQVVAVESDWKLKFIKRGSGATVAVAEADLGAASGG